MIFVMDHTVKHCNLKSTFKPQWFWLRSRFIMDYTLMTTGGFEMWNYYIQPSYLTHQFITFDMADGFGIANLVTFWQKKLTFHSSVMLSYSWLIMNDTLVTTGVLELWAYELLHQMWLPKFNWVTTCDIVWKRI